VSGKKGVLVDLLVLLNTAGDTDTTRW